MCTKRNPNVCTHENLLCVHCTQSKPVLCTQMEPVETGSVCSQRKPVLCTWRKPVDVHRDNGNFEYNNILLIVPGQIRDKHLKHCTFLNTVRFIITYC